MFAGVSSIKGDWAFEPLDSMEDSSSGSSCPDIEHCISEPKFNQSLSVGSFPFEDSTDCEDLTSEGLSGLFLPPVQGAWGTKSVRRSTGRRNKIRDKPEKLREKAIIEILYAYPSCLHEDSLADWPQSDDYQRMDKCQQETVTQAFCEFHDLMKNIKAFLDNTNDDEEDDSVLSDPPQEEDVQPPRSVSSHMDQVVPEEHEACQDLPKWKPPENGDTTQFPEMPLGLEDDEIVEMESQETGTAESASVSAEQSEEEDVPSDAESTSCLNFRGFFHWLRKQVVSYLPGRKRHERANKVPILLALKRRHFVGGHRLLPQESF
ncbi:uncharacterized protein C12orf71 homolog [Marmota flaviventris]|uniref:uncharacterized protein C12orf71 homolog n=1 Tax=Marmota flaviventris TaxID=93162 RepID=UPI003A880D44